MPLGDGRFRLLEGPGHKPRMINTVMDDSDLLFRQAKEPNEIGGGVLAHRDNAILTPRQAADDNPAVKHSLPIVFAFHVKRRQIVDSRHERAWFGPKQTP